jgi:hypothetical protein
VSPPDKAAMENFILSVAVPQSCSKLAIKLQASVLGVVSLTADFIESLCFDLPNEFDNFLYSVPFNYVTVFRKLLTYRQASCQDI